MYKSYSGVWTIYCVYNISLDGVHTQATAVSETYYKWHELGHRERRVSCPVCYFCGLVLKLLWSTAAERLKWLVKAFEKLAVGRLSGGDSHTGSGIDDCPQLHLLFYHFNLPRETKLLTHPGFISLDTDLRETEKGITLILVPFLSSPVLLALSDSISIRVCVSLCSAGQMLWSVLRSDSVSVLNLA